MYQFVQMLNILIFYKALKMHTIYRLIFGVLLIFSLSACEKITSDDSALTEVTSEAISTVDASETSERPVEKKKLLVPIDPENQPPKSAFETVEWTDLLPKEDLEALENPPEYLADIEDGSEADQLNSQLKAQTNVAEDRYQQALVSQNIRPEFDGRYVRIPGFIVPLDFDDYQTITSFFLVPFFGACIHVPPPPPNQIIYAEYEPGIRLNALYDPFWINGKLSTTLVENDLAIAAYSLSVSSIEPYIEEGYISDEIDPAM